MKGLDCLGIVLFSQLALALVASAQEKASSDLARYEDQIRASVIRDAQTLDKELEELKNEARSFNKFFDDLLNNDSGKRIAIAKDKDGAFQSYMLYQEQPVDVAEIDNRLKPLRQSVSSIPESKEPGSTDAILKLKGQIAVCKDWKEKYLKSLQSRQTLLQVVIDANKDEDVSSKLSLAKTIDSVRAARQAAYDKAFLDAQAMTDERAKQNAIASAMQLRAQQYIQKDLTIEEATAKTKAQVETQLAEIKRRSAEASLEAAKIYAQAERTNAEAGALREKGKTDAEMIRKRQECHRPEVLAALKLFTTPGYTQPGSHEQSRDKLPMSLSALESAGARKETEAGLRALFEVGNNIRDKERPHWPFRTYNGNFTRVNRDTASHEQLVQVQRYLIEYGEALREEGLLQP
jgi:hypothetical protein